MTDENSSGSPRTLPGVAAISLWMILLCVLGLVGVTRRSLPPVALIFSAAFALAGLGLMRLRRWGWALTLGAVLCSALYGLWVMLHLHQLGMIVMVVINMILFLYLVRPEVRERMK
jgi:hypothetical protein